MTTPAHYRLGRLHLDVQRRMLCSPQGEHALKPREFDLLMALLSRPKVVWSKAQLMSTVWSGRVVEEAALHQSIARLRRALGPEGRQLIRTVKRIGYALEAEPSTSSPEDGARPGAEQRQRQGPR